MEQLGRYELRERLGRGGFASVFRAWDPLLRREVAIKALSPDWADDPEMRHRFMLEAQTLAGIEHPHIVTVYDVGEVGGRPYFTMPVMEGGSLAARLPPAGGLSLAEAAAIITALAQALDTLHAHRIVHRDVKAENVMFTSSGRTVLMDLGIARDLDGAGLTSHSQVMLSPMAAAPEQIRGLPAGPPADIYALGVLSFTLLAGRPPFTGDTSALLHAHVYDPPPPLWELRPGLPGPVYAAVQEALAKEPARRPATAGSFATALRRAPLPAGGRAEGEQPPNAAAGARPSRTAAPIAEAATVPVTIDPEPRPRRWLLGASLGALAVAAASGVWYLVQDGSPPSQVNDDILRTTTPPPPAETAPPATTPTLAPSPPPAGLSAGANADFTFLRMPLGAASTVDVRINPNRGALTDDRVRRAFAQGVDPAVMQDYVQRFAPTSLFLPADEVQRLGPLTVVSFDPAAARRLLSAAGYPDGVNPTITLTSSTGTDTQRLAALLQDQWQRNTSTRITVRVVERATLAADVTGRQYDLLLHSAARGN